MQDRNHEEKYGTGWWVRLVGLSQYPLIIILSSKIAITLDNDTDALMHISVIKYTQNDYGFSQQTFTHFLNALILQSHFLYCYHCDFETKKNS